MIKVRKAHIYRLLFRTCLKINFYVFLFFVWKIQCPLLHFTEVRLLLTVCVTSEVLATFSCIACSVSVVLFSSALPCLFLHPRCLVFRCLIGNQFALVLVECSVFHSAAQAILTSGIRTFILKDRVQHK